MESNIYRRYIERMGDDLCRIVEASAKEYLTTTESSWWSNQVIKQRRNMATQVDRELQRNERVWGVEYLQILDHKYCICSNYWDGYAVRLINPKMDIYDQELTDNHFNGGSLHLQLRPNETTSLTSE